MNLISFKEFLASNQMLSKEWGEWMLSHIGDLDPDLRDEGIYSGWCRLFEERRIPLSLRKELLAQVLNDELLFTDIDQRKGNGVFIRSFTSLFLTVVLRFQKRDGWPDASEQRQIIEAAILYYQQEKDNRGFVSEYGWAHAFAHGADLLQAAVLSPAFEKQDIAGVLKGLKRGLVEVEDFLFGEEDRMVKPYLALLTSGQLTDVESGEWLQVLQAAVESRENDFNLCYTKFCMCLSFELVCQDLIFPVTQAQITTAMKQFYQKYQIV